MRPRHIARSVDLGVSALLVFFGAGAIRDPGGLVLAALGAALAYLHVGAVLGERPPLDLPAGVYVDELRLSLARDRARHWVALGLGIAAVGLAAVMVAARSEGDPPMLWAGITALCVGMSARSAAGVVLARGRLAALNRCSDAKRS